MTTVEIQGLCHQSQGPASTRRRSRANLGQGCCVSTEPRFYLRPEGAAIELRTPPRLASWNT